MQVVSVNSVCHLRKSTKINFPILQNINNILTTATTRIKHVTQAITTMATVPESASSDILTVPSGCVLLGVIPVPDKKILSSVNSKYSNTSTVQLRLKLSGFNFGITQYQLYFNSVEKNMRHYNEILTV